MSLYNIVKSLRETQGNLAKQAILDANKDDPLFKAYMKAVYDVGINYYATKLHTGVSPGGLATLDQEYLDWLAKAWKERVFVGNQGKALLKVTMATFDAEGQELFSYIIDRSIGASVGDTMVLTTWPDLYFIPPYMRCAGMSIKAREAFAALESFYVQTKRDGSFAYAERSAVGSRVVTRQGSVYPMWFSDRMTSGLPYGKVLVGEMEVYAVSNCTEVVERKPLSRKEGNGILNSVLKGADESEFDGYEFRYVAWDILTAEEFAAGRSQFGYQIRWLELEYIVCNLQFDGHMMQVELIDNVRVHSVAEAKAIHTAKTAAGLEGTVWKTKDGLWKDTSSGTLDAVKVKLVFEVELEVIDYYEGKGKAKGMLGGLTLGTKPNAEGVRELTVDCGSGFTDQARKDLWLTRSILKTQIATVEANEVSTARGRDTMSLSLPIFILLRFDRNEADTLERVLEQYESAKLGK